MNEKVMSTEKKLKIVNKYLGKLMDVAEKGTKERKYDLVLSAVSAYCSIQYSINQIYTDKKSEEILLEISRQLIRFSDEYKADSNVVLFYDGFGLDLRGWAATFAKGITDAGFKLIYMTRKSAAGTIPHVEKEVKAGNGEIVYFDTKISYQKWIEDIDRVFKKYHPGVAFFYTNPNDVCATVVFDAYKDKVKRIQVDLTDHAFWIGTNAFDYIAESRGVGVSNALYHRGIDKEKIRKMDCCLYINTDVDDTPLPFDIEKEKYIFSGGSIYKTLGDDELLFYKMVNHILSAHEDVKFLFAGGGDDSELKTIIGKYPGRAFHIDERSDFYRLFEHCVFFLNTYPMFGGLMMQFAANAGKIPLTLKHGSDHEGILIDQESRGIEFDTIEEAMQEADRLIDDKNYRENKEKGLNGAVVSQKDFSDILKKLIVNGETGDSFDEIPEIDTSDFRREYINRLDTDAVLMKSIATKSNKNLLFLFPTLFCKRIIKRIKK